MKLDQIIILHMFFTILNLIIYYQEGYLINGIASVVSLVFAMIVVIIDYKN